MAGADDTLSIVLQADASQLKSELQASKDYMVSLGAEIQNLRGQMAGLNPLSQQYQQLNARLQEAQASSRAATQEFTQLRAQLEGLQGGTSSATAGFASLESMATRMMLRFIILQEAVRPIVKAFQDAAAETANFEAAIGRLEAVVGALGGDVQNAYASIVQMSAQMAGAFKGSDVAGAFVIIVSRSQDAEQALAALGPVLDMAAAEHIKAAHAAKDYTAALDGNVKGLEGLGVSLSSADEYVLKYGTDAEKVALLNEKLSQSFHGAAEAAKGSTTFWEKAAIALRGIFDPRGAVDMVNAANMAQQAAEAAAKAAAARGGTPAEDAARAAEAKALADAESQVDDRIRKLTEDMGPAAKAADGVRTAFDAQERSIQKQIDAWERQKNLSAEAAAMLENYKGKLQALKDAEPAAEQKAVADAMQKVGEQAAHAAAQVAQIEDEARRAAESSAHIFDRFTAPDLSPLQRGLHEIQTTAEKTSVTIGDQLASAFAKLNEYRASGNEAAAAAEQKLIDQLEHQLGVIQDTEKATEQIYADNYWAKMADQAQKAFDSADKSLQKYIADLQNIPSQFGGTATNEIQQLEQDLEALKEVFAAGLISPEQFSEMNAQIQQSAQELTQGSIEAARQYGEELKRQAEEATRELQSDMQGVFEGILQGGTKGLDTALRDIAKNAGKDFGQMVVSVISHLFVGAAPVEGDYSTWGGPYANYQTAQQQYQQKQGSVMGDVSGVLGLGASLYSTVTTPGMSVGMGALSGAAAGASFGWVGALVGAVLGAVAGALAPSASKDYQYGQPVYQGLTGATFGHAGTTNLSDAATQEYLDQINQTVQNFNNKFAKLLLSFGPQFANMIGSLFANENFSGMEAGTPGGSQWGTIGEAASKNWANHIQAWIQEGLPHMMEDYFWKPLADGLANIGFSQTLIDQIHHLQSTMAPQDWMNYVSGLVNAVMDIQKELNLLGDKSVLTGFHGGQGPTENIWAAAAQGLHGSFQDQMQETDSQILQLGQSLSVLTGQDQVDALNQIDQLMAARYQKELQYIQEVDSAITSVTDSFQSTIRNFTLQTMVGPGGKPDRQAQVQYLQQYLHQLMGLQAGATNVTDVQNYASQINQVIQQIVQLGQQMGGQSGQQFLQWGIQAAQSAQETIVEHLKQLGQQAADDGQKLHDAMQAFIDALLAGSDAINNNSNNTGANQTGGVGGTNQHGGRGQEGPNLMSLSQPLTILSTTATASDTKLGQMLTVLNSIHAALAGGQSITINVPGSGSSGFRTWTQRSRSAGSGS